MSYNVKNYNSQCGDKTFIGGEITILSSGKLKIENGATVEGLKTEGYTLPPAGEAIGGVKQIPSQADSSATTISALKTDFNNLLAKFRAAGIMAVEVAE